MTTLWIGTANIQASPKFFILFHNHIFYGSQDCPTWVVKNCVLRGLPSTWTHNSWANQVIHSTLTLFLRTWSFWNKPTSWWNVDALTTQLRRKPKTHPSTAKSKTHSSSSKTSTAPTRFGQWLQDLRTNAQANCIQEHIPWFCQDSCSLISRWNSGMKRWSDNKGKVSSVK